MDIAFMQARNYTRANRTSVDLIVLHDMEYPEKYDAAEQVARWFSGPSAPQASAHYCIDTDSIVRCVLDKDVAWAAPGANRQGIQIEHAGYARQSTADWSDAYSAAELLLSAQLVAVLCAQYKVPVEYVDVAGLKAGKRGVTTHNNVSLAFKQSTHTDPGPNFPISHYMDLVRGAAAPPKEMRPVVNAPVVAILSHPTWNGGYIQIGADGGTFSWDAPNFGSLGAVTLNSPIVDGDVTPSGQGYTLLGADGGVFDFGDAAEAFEGGMGGTQLAKPCVAFKFTASGKGYWITASDGQVFPFGDAENKGSVEFKG